jgi:hypothetical protein
MQTIIYTVLGIAAVLGGAALVQRRMKALPESWTSSNEAVAYGLIWLFAGIATLGGVIVGDDDVALYGSATIIVGTGVLLLMRVAWRVGGAFYSQARTDDVEGEDEA